MWAQAPFVPRPIYWGFAGLDRLSAARRRLRYRLNASQTAGSEPHLAQVLAVQAERQAGRTRRVLGSPHRYQLPHGRRRARPHRPSTTGGGPDSEATANAEERASACVPMWRPAQPRASRPFAALAQGREARAPADRCPNRWTRACRRIRSQCRRIAIRLPPRRAPRSCASPATTRSGRQSNGCTDSG